MTGTVPSCEPQVRLAETGASMTAAEGLGCRGQLAPLPLHPRGVARQHVLQSMRTLEAGERERVPGAGHATQYRWRASTESSPTPEFTEETAPPGLRRSHRTRAGTWGLIVVIDGRLLYRILRSLAEELILNPDHPGVVEPEVEHEVEPMGRVRFYVEFYR